MRDVVSDDPFELVERLGRRCDLIDEAEAVAPTWVIPIALEKRGAAGIRDQADGVEGGDVGVVGQVTETPLWLKVCCTRWRIVLSKLWICWAVG